MSGKLYLVATPIGNLDDITIRALNVLKEVDYIAAEDTRHTIKLLNHYNIKKKLISYHEHNKIESGKKIIEDIKSGFKIALVTDAGTPGISDPGSDLVKKLHENYLSVTSIPGPVALINGLILSNLDTKRFCFEGFLPQDKKHRKSILEILKNETRTIILYEAPHKLKKTIVNLYEVLGNRKISICRELTKRYEEIINTDLEKAITYYNKVEPKGEFVLIIQGISIDMLEKTKIKKWLEMTLDEHMEYYLNKKLTRKEAIKQIAKDRKMPKREVYNYFNI